MSLYDFEELADPEIVRGERVKHPDLERDEVVGWMGRWAKGSCYLSPRTRDEHFFRNKQGYAISTALLDYILTGPGREVETVFIAERETGTLFEFSMGQFADGAVLDFDGYDEQRLVPVADARRTWEKDDVTIQ